MSTINNQPSGEKSTFHKAVTGHVGYKRPPVKARFKKGRSGNPKGRPKGRPNFANLMKELFNANVSIRNGDKTQHMPSFEAIVRVQMANASKGDKQALFALLGILEMMGRTSEVSEEEKKRRQILLPQANTREEFDLLVSPARAKERQRLLAKYNDDEAKGCAPQGDPDKIAVGGGSLSTSFAQLGKDAGNLSVMKELSRDIARIGLLADDRLFAGDFAGALKYADQAIAQAPESDVMWIHVIRAHACMFLGQVAEARKFYLQFQSNKRVTLTSWETVILQDFSKLRRAGYSHLLMAEIEKRLVDAGWTAQSGPALKSGLAMKKGSSALKSEDLRFMMMNPNHIETGPLLVQQGKLDEAAEVYRFNIAKSQSKLAKNKNDIEAQQILDLAEVRLGFLAHKFIHQGSFCKALECAEELIALAPDRLMLHAIRAQALMFIGRTDDVHELFLRHRGEKIGEDTWESVILADFEEHRRASRSHPLIDEIETKFAAGGPIAQASPENVKPANNNADLLPNIAQLDDIPSGDLLAEQGRLDDALAVYGRRLAICKSNFVNNRAVSRTIDERNRVIEKISGLTGKFLTHGEFEKALAAADCALSALPDSPRLNVYRAHALMFLDHADEARTLYLRYRGKKIDAQRSGESVILADLATMREAGLMHALMNEIEKRFAAGE